jgi:peptidoglycan/LPS O-acetylase OafA/YrhL
VIARTRSWRLYDSEPMPAAIPEAVAPPPRHPRFPLLDAMRAIAAGLIVVLHAAVFGGAISGSIPGRLLAHLNVGVTIFFLISGFLLYRPFIAHRGGGPGAPRVRDYSRRRLLRIYPAYWLVLTVLLVIPNLPKVDYESVWPMYALLHTLPLGQGPRCSELVNSCGLAQTWSLVAEVTFYAALPLYVLLVERLTLRQSRRRWAISQAVLLTVLSAVSVLVQYVILSPSPEWVGWSVVGNIFWFALGMGLAIVSTLTHERPAGRTLARFTARYAVAIRLLAAAIYVALCLWLPPTPFVLATGHQLAIYLVFGLIALLVLIPAIFTTGERSRHRLIATRPLGWLGLISYGIFLWHYPVELKLSRIGSGLSFVPLLAATVAITVPIAAFSYYALERPLMRFK